MFYGHNHLFAPFCLLILQFQLESAGLTNSLDNMKRIIQTNEVVRALGDDYSSVKGCSIKFNKAMVVTVLDKCFMVEPLLEGELMKDIHMQIHNLSPPFIPQSHFFPNSCLGWGGMGNNGEATVSWRRAGRNLTNNYTVQTDFNKFP